MFERFTERARHVVTLAQDEAKALKHDHIGTEHILLGLILEQEGLAARVLFSFDVTLERARKEVVRYVGRADSEPRQGMLPFTPYAKKALESALREALQIGHNYIGTEHILLGLMHEGTAARILLEFDADYNKVYGEVEAMLSGPGRKKDTSGLPPLPEGIEKSFQRVEVGLKWALRSMETLREDVARLTQPEENRDA